MCDDKIIVVDPKARDKLGQFAPLYVQYQLTPHVVERLISETGPPAWG
jgi:hypothetical protein